MSSMIEFRYFCSSFKIASTIKKIEKETLMYPEMSFISEIGGGLGLFIGFSFLTIMDVFEFMYEKCKFATSFSNTSKSK